jgi:hypothetical protein
MNYRFEIQGRYFLVAVFFLNIMALLPFALIIKDPTPHENVVRAGILAFMTLQGAGMCWCLWAIMPQPLPSYNRFQNFLYRRRSGKPWLHRAATAIFAINLCVGIAIRFKHHGHLTQGNVSNWILIGSSAFVLLINLWPLQLGNNEDRCVKQ